MAKGQFDKFQKKIDRYTTSVLNGQLTGAEEVVKLLQFRGPSWTGRYSNSWQIRVGNEKRLWVSPNYYLVSRVMATGFELETLCLQST